MLIGSAWSNSLGPLNVNGDADGIISPIDVLLVINELNNRTRIGPDGRLPAERPVDDPFIDVNCDNIVSPIDALFVVNHLNGSELKDGLTYRTSNGGAGAYSPIGCGAIIEEGNSFVSSITTPFIVPANAQAVSMDLLGIELDESSQGFVRDAFEISLLDPAGRSLVSTAQLGGDSFFNSSEGQAFFNSSQVVIAGNRITLSLEQVLPGAQADLVFRLINNDTDTLSTAGVRSVQFESTFNRPEGSQRNSSQPDTSSLADEPKVPFDSLFPTQVIIPPLASPTTGAIVGRSPTIGPASNVQPAAPQGASEGGDGSVIDSRGTEFWIGFPDNLFEGVNVPQKALHITGDVASTGFVEIPGLIDPDTSEAFRADFVVNPGEVTAVELPSQDRSDNSLDDQTDYDVEAELVGLVQRLGVHVVAQDPVAVYGISRAVNTTDAFLALPVDSLGTEYINLGYGNTHRLTASPIGSQFLVVATEDETEVDITPGSYTFPVSGSDSRIQTPSGTSRFDLGNTAGLDIGPFSTNEAGEWSFTVSPPFDGYSGNYRFETVDVAAAATPVSIGDLVTLNFPTGREAKVVSFDVTAAQQLAYDAINPSDPSATVRLISPSGVSYTLGVNGDQNTFINQFNPLRFDETGTYYMLVVGEQESGFDFNFRMIDMEQAPTLPIGTPIGEVFDPRGQGRVYQFEGQAGQQIYLDSHDSNREVGFDLLGPGGQLWLRSLTAGDQLVVLPETGTYYFVLNSSYFRDASFDFTLVDLADAPLLPAQTATNYSYADGSSLFFKINGVAGQTFAISDLTGMNLGSTGFQLYDPAGKLVVSKFGANLSGRMLITGDYTLIIGGLNPSTIGDGTFQTSQIADGPVAKSGLNAMQTLTIAAGESATYEFAAPAGTPFILDGLDIVSENLNVEVKGPDGSRLFTGFSTAAEVRDIPFEPTFLPQSGIYSITLRGNDATASGSYSFRVLDLESFPAPLTLGVPITATLPDGQENLFYAFEAVAGQVLHLDGTINESVPLQVFDPFLQRLVNVTVRNDSGTRIVHSGRHYVRIAGNQTQATDVSFTLFGDESVPVISFGQRVAGTLTPGLSRAVFRIELEAGQHIRYESLDSTVPNKGVSLSNAGGRTILSGNANADNAGGRPFNLVRESGVYFVAINGNQTADVTYDFRIDNLDLAPLLDFDTETSIVLDPGVETRTFRIQANVGDLISVDNTTTTSRALNWQLVGTDHNTYGSSNDGRDFSAAINTTDIYYLVISGRSSIPLPVDFRITRMPGDNPQLSGVNEEVDLNVGIRETGQHTWTAPVGRIIYHNVMETEFAIQPHSVTLQQGETYLLQDQQSGLFTFNPDLTGSIITSNHPIAVLAGNRCTFVPTQFFACDHLIEQLPPTETWGREFLTVPLATGTAVGDRYRFLAQTDGTEVTVNGEVVATLNRGEFHEQIQIEAAFIESNGPILVAQYAHSQSFYQQSNNGDPAFGGDPFMVFVPPFEQYLSSYTLSTPAEDSIPEAERFDRNFINVVAPVEAVGQIEIDGVAIDASEFTAIGDSGFFGAQIPIALGSYDLAGPLPFGAVVYGFGSFDSYGYAGGQALTPINDVGGVTLTPAIARPQLNESQTLTARVTDASGAPIPGIRVDFVVSGVNSQRSFGFSDDQGNVVFSYIGTRSGRDVVTASAGAVIDDSIIDWASAAAPPQLTVTSPLDGSIVPAGTELVATGFAVADFPNATLDLVMVNGQPVESIDAGGNFFVRLFVGPGDNEFEFEAIDSNGSVTSVIVTLSGEQRTPTDIDFTLFSDVSGSFQVAYARTSYRQDAKHLFAETAVENLGQFPTDVPLLVGITNLSDPMVLVRDPDAISPDGVPLYDFTGLVAGGTLEPRSLTGFLSASFYNPNQTQFTYDLLFLGKLNEAPQFGSIPVSVASVGREYRYQAAASDVNREEVTFALAEGPASMTLDASSGLIAWSPTSNDVGVHSIEVVASDPRGAVTSQRFALTVENNVANRVPVLNSQPIALAHVGLNYAYQVQALDADGDSLTFALQGSPSGMSIDALSGEIGWLPTPTQLGDHTVVVEVSDGRGGTTRQAFSVTVLSPSDNLAPVIVNPPPLATKVGNMTHQVIALDGDQESLSYELLDGPAGLSLDASGLLSWTSTVSDVGAHHVALQVRDSRGGVDRQSFMLAVFDNQDPQITSAPILTAQVGSPYSYQATASDSVDDMLSYRLLDAPLGMTIVSSSGVISWDVTEKAYEQESVTVQVSDGRGGRAHQQFAISVAGGQPLGFNRTPFFVSTPPTVASVGNKLLYPVVARDPNGDTLTFDLPLAPEGMVIDPTTGQLGWRPRVEQDGMQQVVIRVIDGNNAGVWLQTFQIQVDASNTAPVITSVDSATALVGRPWELYIQSQDADGGQHAFRLDGAPAGATLTQLTDNRALLALTPAASGASEIIVEVSDDRGAVTQQRIQLDVSATGVNLPPVVNSTPRPMIAAGQPWVYLIDIKDPDFDPLVISLTQAPSGMALDAVSRIISWEPDNSQLGIHPVTLTYDDGQGGVTTESFSVEVTAEDLRRAPRIVSPPAAFRATVGQSFAYELRAVDDDGDPVEWTLVEAPHGTSIDRRLGTLRWTPTVDQIGSQRFIVSAMDPSGREALQSFSLQASTGNLSPILLSAAPSEAVVGRRYVYGIRAVDPENDPLVFSLGDGPTGMTIDNARGIVAWTPTIDQLGTASVTVDITDSQGNAASQTFSINVTELIRNQPPVINSRAIFRARVDAEYQYDVEATDPELETISYSLVEAPSGMQIDAVSGLITWMPAAADAGAHLVRVAATDTSGNVSVQRYALQARVNQTPVITSMAPLVISVGALYRYDIQVDEPENDDLTFELLVKPNGMTIDAFGRILWSTDPSVAALNQVVINVTDSFGASVMQSYTLDVTPDTTAPMVTIQLSANSLVLGGDSVVIVQASDDVGVTSVSLTRDGVPLVLDANRSVTIRGDAAGLFSLQASALDASGNQTTTSVELRIFDPADTTGPTITITSPQASDIVTTLTDIVGSVTDDNLDFYHVDVARADLVDINNPTEADADYKTISTGNAAAIDEVLGTFDPTMLHNDDHVIRILAQDLSGNVSAKTLTLGLDGQLKLGQFALDFTDLSIPVSGIPITVTRSYDTRNANEQGDFGFGWTLSVSDPDIRETLPTTNLERQGLFYAATPFREGTRVYLTNPEGRRIGFTFVPQRGFSLFGGGHFTANFVPDPGVTDRLEVGSPQLRRINGAFYEGFAGAPFNPSAYRLTTKEGAIYEYGQFSGLDNIRDRSGNRIDIRLDGIFSSLGPSIEFVRDPLGRIEQIVDPAGNVLRYSYDAAGDLTHISDQADLSDTYAYRTEPAHFLDLIVDPSGAERLKVEFDSDGRLSSSVNAIGASTVNEYDPSTLQEVITDPLGNQTTITFNDRGNVIEANRPNGVIQMEYDDRDNLVRAVDEAGNVVTQEFDKQGNLTRIVDPLGGAFVSTFNSVGQITGTTDPLGRQTQLAYNESGKLTHFVNAMGESSFGEHDDRGRLIAATDPLGNRTVLTYADGPRAQTVAFLAAVSNEGGSEGEGGLPPTRHYVYNDFGQVVRFVDENGNATEYAFDTIGRPTSTTDAAGGRFEITYEGDRFDSLTDPLGRTTRFEYDASGRRIRIIDPAGGVYREEYNDNNQITRIIDQLGNATVYTYLPIGEVETITDPLGGFTKFEYDQLGRRVAAVDANGGRTQFAYDALGHLTQTTNPLGAITRQTYDPVGNLLSSTDANGNTSRLQYDTLNRVVQQIDAQGFTFAIEYDANGNQVKLTNPKGESSLFEYDMRDRMVRAVNAEGFERVRVFDPVGNLVAFTNELGETTRFEYDPVNRGTKTTNPLGGTTLRTLDAYGNTIQYRDELGRTSSYEFDVLNRLKSITDTGGHLTQFAYDAVGNEIKFTDPLGNVTRRDFDAIGRLTQVVDPLQKANQYEYDAIGNRTASVDRNGRRREYDFDLANRLVEERWLEGTSVVRVISASYDSVGNLQALNDPSGSLGFTFDSRNQLATESYTAATRGVDSAFTFGYDALGNLTEVVDVDGTTFNRNIDPRNLNRSTTYSGGGVDPLRVDFEYDARGVRTSAKRYSDLDASQLIGSTTQAFDSAGRLTGISHLDAVGQVLADYEYEFDPFYRISRLQDSSGEANYTYDANNQLTEATYSSGTDETFEYDGNGNRQGNEVVIGQANRLMSDGTHDFQYDDEGNLTSRTVINSGETTEYSYDHRNQLVRVETKDQSGATLSASTYGYDPLGRRIEVEQDGAVRNTTYFGSMAWADYDGAGVLQAKFVPGESIDERLGRYRPGEGAAWYLPDHLGSVRDIMDSEGRLIDHVVYSSFGQMLSETHPAAGDRFKFTGREYDAAVELYYYRARYYDPNSGRFLSEDPIGFGGGDTNQQRYVGNNTINAVDPTGTLALVSSAAAFANAILVTNVAVTFGKDVPFTFRVGCKPEACGISSSIDGSNLAIDGIKIGGEHGISIGIGRKTDANGDTTFTWSATGELPGIEGGFSGDTKGNLDVKVAAKAGEFKGEFKGRLAGEKAGESTSEVSFPGLGAPKFGTEKAELPMLPDYPDDDEFDFQVKSTAKSDNLLVSANLAIFVGVALQLELIANVAVAQEWETLVGVGFEATLDNPAASVRADGFAFV